VSELEAAIVELTASTAAAEPVVAAPDERHPAAAYLAAGESARR